MSNAGQALLDEVLTIKKGAPAKTWTPEQLLVISVRKQLKKSQPACSKLLGVPVGTIRDWEQGRKQRQVVRHQWFVTIVMKSGKSCRN